MAKQTTVKIRQTNKHNSYPFECEVEADSSAQLLYIILGNIFDNVKIFVREIFCKYFGECGSICQRGIDKDLIS